MGERVYFGVKKAVFSPEVKGAETFFSWENFLSF